MTMRCDEARPLLFALDENGVTPAERAALARHLATCRACRREREDERRLSAVLMPRRRRRRVAPALGVAAAVLLAVLLFQPRDAFGSIEPRTLTPELTLRDGEPRPLRLSNHVAVPTGESCRIRIRGVAVVRADGPAVFELDRTDGRWKLTLLAGEAHVDVERDGEVVAVTLEGPRALVRGPHWICLGDGDGDAPPAPNAAPYPAELIEQGQDAFFRREDMPAAEKAFRAAMDHPDTTPAQRTRAHFYWAASLGRQEKWAEAVAAQADWLERYPEDESRHYVLFFQGVYLENLGKAEEARACWRKILREDPKGRMSGHAARKLGAPAQAKAAARDPGYRPGRVLPADAGRPGGYLVVTFGKRPGFAEVARKVAAHHKGDVVAFEDFDALERRLRRDRPENVLFVVPPEMLDVNLHRRLLLLSAKLDDDIFPDFSFGYFTARDAEALGRLWERTKRLHEHGVSSKRWVSAAVSTKCLVYPGSVADIAAAAGFTGDSIYWGYETPRAEMEKFVGAHLHDLEKAGVITLTGCGDPQGTWLFSDKRNLQREKHWDYAPDKVGHDPEGEMPRITAGRIRALKLDAPIVWTGVCHAGATRRVFVEGDIVSTFGRTNGIGTLHELAPDESFCLAMIDAGAAAYLCPIGANHGGSVAREFTFALEHGASLGEAIKSTYDEVFRAARGELVLGLQEPGKPQRDDGYVMQGGGANRILIGDPALRPFARTQHPGEKVEIKDRSDTGFTVVVTWQKGYRARAWDMYRNDRSRDWCVQTRIDLDGLVPAGKAARIAATVEAEGADGKAMPYVMVDAEPEVYHGRRHLHLQASAPRKEAGYYEYVRATFRVTFGE